jgi:S-adenosylmethionine:tRNA ribosyltransferase-isomerase
LHTATQAARGGIILDSLCPGNPAETELKCDFTPFFVAPPIFSSYVPMSLTLDQFDFDLPPLLIAQHPCERRDGSRLLYVDAELRHDRVFSDLPALLGPDDLLIFNDTRVIKARFFGEKDSGGKIEVLIERIVEPHLALAQVRASKTPKVGSRLTLEGACVCHVNGRDGEFFRLELPAGSDDWWHLTEHHGRLPLPPYIDHTAGALDEARYQTVYARHPGAVAAPTAGLHFDEALLQRLRHQGVHMAWLTLHVGAGTFQPVRVNDLAQHRMHRERYTIPEATVAAIRQARVRGGRVIAVGTTSLRALESAAQGGLDADGAPPAGDNESELFIVPGYRFRVVDRLITNFHLPKSTLLMLVSAFAGTSTIRSAYRHAIDRHYRFFSYGDAMLLERQAAGNDHA